MRNAKIVCTLGPASSSLRVLEDLATAGMSVARVNASHGEPDDLRPLLESVRDVGDRIEQPLATMLDLQGPEIRTIAGEKPVRLESGDEVTFEPDVETVDGRIGISPSLVGVDEGDRILLDDGRIVCHVTEVEADSVRVHIETGGVLRGRKGVNVPGVSLDLEMITAKDRSDLELVTSGAVDFVAASFVRSAEDVFAVNAALEAMDCDVPIIAKIERAGAVENLAEIIEAAYGVMIARGDLGVECPMEDVPLIQKRIIQRCRDTGTPVITATEMLDSMVESARPTRAEASDVANAVLDGTDAVMLSGETAMGSHPVLVVETMDRIIRQVEASEEYADLREQRVPPATESRTDALARSGRYLARDLDASAIVAASESGYTALKAAKYRPAVPVVAATVFPEVYRRLAISWGIRPHILEAAQPTAADVIEDGVRIAIGEGIAESGDTVVVIAGLMREIEGSELTNTLKVHVAAETLATGRVVVAGRASGPLFQSPSGDLTDASEGAIILLPPSFEGEFSGDTSRLGGIVAGDPGLTGYPAMVARELGVPMISGTIVEKDVSDGTQVTLDAERGVLYEGDIYIPSLIAERESEQQ